MANRLCSSHAARLGAASIASVTRDPCSAWAREVPPRATNPGAPLGSETLER